MIDSTVPIGDLAAGQAAVISRVVGHADHVHRLEEFGLRVGTRVEMFRPGNPCIIRLAGAKVCFRAEQVIDILVQPKE